MRRNAFRSMLTVGVEDGSFQKGISRKALLAAVLLRELKIEKARIVEVTVDGLDATEKLAEILRDWKFSVLMLAGVSCAGFNIIDPTVIHERFKKPVVIITRTKPDNKAVKRALRRHFEDWKMRWGAFEKLGKVHKITVMADEPPIYVETVGVAIEWACDFIRMLSVCSRVPEPIRIARLVARGLSQLNGTVVTSNV